MVYKRDTGLERETLHGIFQIWRRMRSGPYGVRREAERHAAFCLGLAHRRRQKRCRRWRSATALHIRRVLYQSGETSKSSGTVN
jgi:hypothetical protein